MELLIGKRQNSGITLNIRTFYSEDLDSEDELVRRIYREYGEGIYTVTYKPYKQFQKLWQGRVELIKQRELGKDNIKYFRDFSDLEKEISLEENDEADTREEVNLP